MPIVAFHDGRLLVSRRVSRCPSVDHPHRHLKLYAIGRFAEQVSAKELLYRRTQTRHWRAHGRGRVQRARIAKLRRDMHDMVQAVREELGLRGPIIPVFLTGEAEAHTAFRAAGLCAVPREAKGAMARSAITNHFPGMRDAVDKAAIESQVATLRAKHPGAFAYFPMGWDLSSDEGLTSFRTEFERRAAEGDTRTYILKPQRGSCGGGIRLAQTWSDVARALELGREAETGGSWLAQMRGYGSLVAQEYIAEPALLDGFKFDCRLYVIMRSLRPLRAFVMHEGMARVCAEKYAKPAPGNLGDAFVHLTNYSVNKGSDKFQQGVLRGGGGGGDGKSGGGGRQGNKRLISTAIRQLRAAGLSISAETFWQRIDAMVSKTLLAIQPRLLQSFAKEEADVVKALAPRGGATDKDKKSDKSVLNPYTGATTDPRFPATVWVVGAGSDAVDGEYWQRPVKRKRRRPERVQYEKMAFDGRIFRICRARVAGGGASGSGEKWWISRIEAPSTINGTTLSSTSNATHQKQLETDLYNAPSVEGDQTPPRSGWVVLKGGQAPPPRLDSNVDRLLRSLYKVPPKPKRKDSVRGAGGSYADWPVAADYEKSYQILGFDFILDSKCLPHLLEVNANPSMMHNGQEFDRALKTAVQTAAMEILDGDPNKASDDGSGKAADRPCKEKLSMPYCRIEPESLYPGIAQTAADVLASLEP